MVSAAAADFGPWTFCTVTYRRLYLTIMTILWGRRTFRSVLVTRAARCLRIRGCPVHMLISCVSPSKLATWLLLVGTQFMRVPLKKGIKRRL